MNNTNFGKELRDLINKYSEENNSNTPDFILANYVLSCMKAFNNAVVETDKWYGRSKVDNNNLLRSFKSYYEGKESDCGNYPTENSPNDLNDFSVDTA